jgi:L,D-transpeptidase-like protein
MLLIPTAAIGAGTAQALPQSKHRAKLSAVGLPITRDLHPVTTTSPSSRHIVVPRDGGALAIFSSVAAPAPSQVLPATDELGSPLALLAVGEANDWLHVLLPNRPNGSSGWVRAADVTTSVPGVWVDISLSARTLRVVRMSDAAVLLTSQIGIGAPSTPTPTGEFFVRDLFATSGGNHPYGPMAFGLSGHSDVYMRFGTGDGRIAIHGTNQPASIGAAVSNGCVHVPNDIDVALERYLILGTPVVIS